VELISSADEHEVTVTPVPYVGDVAIIWRVTCSCGKYKSDKVYALTQALGQWEDHVEGKTGERPSDAQIVAMAEALKEVNDMRGLSYANAAEEIVNALGRRGWKLTRAVVGPDALGYGSDDAHAEATQHNSI
jgi:hypothetical protein